MELDPAENVVTHQNIEMPEHRNNQVNHLLTLPAIFQRRPYCKRSFRRHRKATVLDVISGFPVNSNYVGWLCLNS